jgi:hypothetical protein
MVFSSSYRFVIVNKQGHCCKYIGNGKSDMLDDITVMGSGNTQNFPDILQNSLTIP